MTITVLAGALTAGQAMAASASVPARVSSRHIAFDHQIVVSGTVPQADAGHTLELEFLSAGDSSWRTLTSGKASSDGSYRLTARLRRSGYVRVVDASAAATGSAVPAVRAASAAGASSNAEHVSVSAALHVRRRTFASLGGRPITVRGHFLPAVAGQRVWLQAQRGRGWRTVASAHTGSGGQFALRYTPARGSQRLRVHFAGDVGNAKSSAPAGTVTAYQATVASWYFDGGNTACGFHARYGVANRYLPCGTKVKFFYGGRSVTAVVDDRGPYVGGRTWDLSQNTAAALGFGGVDTVWSSF